MERGVTLEELLGMLASHGVPSESWGAGSGKTIEHLVRELREGEAWLEVVDGVLVRYLTIAYVRVTHTGPLGQRYVLHEDRQVFHDGRERSRSLDGYSLAEKLKPGEAVDENLAARALSEELGLDGPFPSVKYLGSEVIRTDSPSFPGLAMHMTTHAFGVEISEEQFQAHGYVERQEDKDTYFVWKLDE